DQMRAQLDEQQTVLDTVAGGSEQITINGKQQHVISYLADFLFAPARSRQPVKVLSGGERNRLLLAKLFTQPANLLVLDEPTNDLDLETLELLEERLLHFTGTLLLVSHDRAFIDRVVTSTLVFEGKGNIQAYVGGYTDWLRQRPAPAAHTPDKSTPKSGTQPGPKAKPKKAAPVQRELAALPGKIDTLEAQLSSVQEQLAASYQAVNGQAQQQALQAQQQQLEAALQAAYDRWETLEAG
ncbi:MAG: ATP-binding cassette domain-containing protein, partial [Pseudomonadota bacterium]